MPKPGRRERPGQSRRCTSNLKSGEHPDSRWKHYLETLTDDLHVRRGHKAEALEFTYEVRPMHRTPILQRSVALAFVIGEPLIDLVERDEVDLRRPDDATTDPRTVRDDAEVPGLRNSLALLLICGQGAGRRTLGTRHHDIEQTIPLLNAVAELP